MSTVTVLEIAAGKIQQTTFTAGFPVYSGSSGALSAPIVWIGTATVSSGAWSVTYSSAGFTVAPVVTATAQGTASSALSQPFCGLDAAPTTTGASGYAMTGTTLLALGGTLVNAPNGTIINVIAIGH